MKPNLTEDLRPFRVLLAEDDNELRRLLATCLRNDGFEVIEASDCGYLIYCLSFSEADYPDHVLPDIIVSDNRMPGMTGLEALEGLRKADWATPFILITAFGDEATHAEALRLGAAAVFDKPFDVRELRRSVMAHALVG